MLLDPAQQLSSTKPFSSHVFVGWTDHVVRMEDTRLPKQILYKRYKDNLKQSLQMSAALYSTTKS